MYKVGIIGPESTGKSTLAKYLANRYHGIYVPEYAREYMEALPPSYQYTYDDVLCIARHQVEQLRTYTHNDSNVSNVNYLNNNHENDESNRINPVVFFDTELIITKVWFLHKYGTCPDFLENALHTYPMDVYLLCYPDLPWVYDPVRENPDLRQYLYDWYEREIQSLNISYYIIRHNQ